MDQKHTIYTVGHGGRRFSEVMLCLEQYDIHRIIDVRSTPYSAYARAWDRKVLKRVLPTMKYEYIYWGKTLGEKSDDRGLYGQDGILDYERIADTPVFKQSLMKILSYCDAHTVLLGSKISPIRCHRSLLIGRNLKKMGVEVKHIITGVHPYIRTQEDIEDELIETFFAFDRYQLNLFAEPLSTKEMIETSYRLQNKRVGWSINLDLEYANEMINSPQDGNDFDIPFC